MSSIVLYEADYEKPMSITINTGDTYYELLVENGKITILANGAMMVHPVTGNAVEISTTKWRLTK